MKYPIRVCSLALMACLLLATSASAHKVNLFAYVEGGIIFTESYFPGGRPVKQGRVEIRDSDETLLVNGMTDDAGLYQVAIPKVDDLTIEIKASMGHRNSFALKKAEIEAGQ